MHNIIFDLHFECNYLLNLNLDWVVRSQLDYSLYDQILFEIENNIGEEIKELESIIPYDYNSL